MSTQPTGDLMDAIPVWGLFVVISIMIVAAEEVGWWLGSRRRALCDQEQNPVSAMVGATLGLLAFVLAFTFGMAAERFEKRRQVIVDESNSIGTTWLRANMLPEHGPAIRRLLMDYVDLRVEVVRSKRLIEGVKQSDEILDRLWALATEVGRENPQSPIVALFVQSLNETTDLHSKRIHYGFRSRIPGAIWWSLCAVAIASLITLGYHGALVARRRPIALFAVMVAFASIMGLIADLDRPLEGLLQVSQQSMIDLQTSMHAAP